MAAALKASLQLTLEDKLTAGLNKLKQQLDELRNIAGSLGLGELENALGQLRGDNVDRLAAGLKGVGRQADAATASLDRLRAANENVINVNGNGVAQLNRSLGALVVVPGGGGGAGAGAPPGGGSGTTVGAPLLLPGPPGAQSGIPLNFSNGAARLGAAGAGLANAGKGVLGAAGGLGAAANEAMSGAMGAAMEGFAVYEPIKGYADFENVLRHIAITEKLSGAAADAEIVRLNKLFATDALASGQSSESIARAYSDLVQTGISASIIDRVIGAHSRAATAYNISPEAMGPAVGALLQNMKIPEDDIGSALSAMAYASKEGRFKVEDFSRQLPGTTGYLSLLGMTGRKSADIGFAALETVMKNAAEPNQAAADFNDALHYITSPIAKRSFAKAGINLQGMEDNAAKRGINPLDAVLGKLDSIVAGMSSVDAGFKLGSLLHNQQAGMAVLSLLQHKDDFLRLRQTLDGVNKSVADTDFATAFAAPVVQIRLLHEQLEQLNRILGQGFLPALKIVSVLLTGLLAPLTWLNENFPNVTKYVLGTAGAFLTLAAGVGIFKVVAPIFKASWKVITSVLEFFGAVLEAVVVTAVELFSALTWPIALVIAAVAALAAAAYDIYENWGKFEPFFGQMWDGIKNVFEGFLEFVKGVFTLDFERAWAGIKQAGGGLGQFYTAEWNVVKGVFNDFVTWLDSWTGGLGTRILTGIKSGWSALVDGFGQLIQGLEDRLTNTALGRMLHLVAEAPQISGTSPNNPSPAQAAAAPTSLATAPPAPAPGRADTLAVTVAAQPGTAVTGIRASNPNHIVSKPDTGKTLNWP